ncbi:MFS transporter [Algoriphagus mannitolivorans]|uniref:MFS transporter n=1 Tax=Algoriphagus mannitolivorans TaxID=226504 RepID=UPI00047AF950|nr:MFS transporter [Algoriphagus mannitolivorans]
MPQAISPSSALRLIVIAQFLGTSLWFAGNAAAPEWEILLNKEGITPMITSVVQLGFITGTLLYALGSIPDRYSPSKVFLISAILASFSNICIVILPLSYPTILIFRFLVGFFLAGIYPVGMKIAADYFEKGLGSALGYLVGALVLGTALPFLLKALEVSFSWKYILVSTSALAIIGGFLIGIRVPNGPFRKINPKLDFGLFPKFSRNNQLKGAASGYFGHMWELYTFWAFLPGIIFYLNNQSISSSRQSLWTFLIIGAGGLSCAIGGIIATKTSSQKVAMASLIGSGICGLLFLTGIEFPKTLIFPFLLIWGIMVTADSPQFSTLVAQSVQPENRGTALTLVNCLGFGLTIFSIQFTQFLSKFLDPYLYFGLLSIGPVVGVFLFRFFRNKKAPDGAL